MNYFFRQFSLPNMGVFRVDNMRPSYAFTHPVLTSQETSTHCHSHPTPKEVKSFGLHFGDPSRRLSSTTRGRRHHLHLVILSLATRRMQVIFLGISLVHGCAPIPLLHRHPIQRCGTLSLVRRERNSEEPNGPSCERRPLSASDRAPKEFFIRVSVLRRRVETLTLWPSILTRSSLSLRQIPLGPRQISPLAPHQHCWYGWETTCGIEKAMQESEDKFRDGEGITPHSPIHTRS
ncbi:hypothetical protein BGY98DRAFT_742935 [Russula aff. rugulosa BPL654]|nr:hypothetical protein BGY98DRAFT_742935 [Russula aff. rugulosa BPL654]